MLHHVSVGVTDFERAAAFYDAVLGALGYRRVMDYSPHAIGYGANYPNFWVQLPHDRGQASAGNGAHFSFIAGSARDIDRFYALALDHGGTDNGPPGPREDYGPDYYGAFVIDPDGNRIEATLAASPKPKRKAARKKAPARKSVRTKSKSPARKAANPAKKAKTAKTAKKGKKPARKVKGRR
jgi:catechol 2,3-dioxygenase-like lactoylglutathione lyase family enzyme